MLSKSRIGWVLGLDVALELLEMKWEMASFSPGPILFAFPVLAHSPLVWGLRVFYSEVSCPQLHALSFPFSEITT